jgi:hypothetical protein
VNVDDAIERPQLPAKYCLGEMLACEDMSGIAQQSLQQSELHTGQIE